MGAFSDLDTLDRARSRPQACPKGLPHQIVKKERKQSKAKQADDFRKAVWLRDRNRSRATGKPLSRTAVDFDRRGEVHHVIPRSLAPERIFDIQNGLLLSATEHKLAETRCPNAPDLFVLEISGPDNRGERQTFRWRDLHGTIAKERIG